MEKYDVAIIGSGMGGLFSGALLAKAGYNVAVFEKQSYPGGLCSSFNNGGYIFDVAVDAIGGLKSGELLHSLSSRLGILEKLDTIALDPVRRTIFPDFYIDIPPEIERHKNDLKERFPEEAPGLDGLFDIMEHIYNMSMLSANGTAFSDSFGLIKWIGKDFESLLNEYVSDLKLKAVLSSYSTFLGLPASKVSAIAAVNTLMHYVKGGAYRIGGGMISLANELVSVIESAGGQVFLSEEVINISYSENKIAGIVTDKGRIVIANQIVSDIAPKHLLSSILDENIIDEDKVSRVDSMKVSGSFVIAYIGADASSIDVSHAPSSIGYFTSFEVDSMLNRGNDISFGMSMPSLVDPSVAPSGNHNIVMHFPLCDGVTVDRNEITDKMIKLAENIIPGLSNGIKFCRVADAGTILRYTANSEGAAYGWSQKAGFYGNLPFLRDLVENLHIVGHWAGLGGGIMPSAISAIKTAEKISGKQLLEK